MTDSFIGKISSILNIKNLNKFKKRFDPRLYNGAILLGLDSPVVKSHGSTDFVGFANSLTLCELFELRKACEQQNIILEDINEDSLLYDMKREINKIKEIAHSDYVYKEINTYGLDVDIVVEAKMKEQAILNKIKKPSYV